MASPDHGQKRKDPSSFGYCACDITVPQKPFCPSVIPFRHRSRVNPIAWGTFKTWILFFRVRTLRKYPGIKIFLRSTLIRRKTMIKLMNHFRFVNWKPRFILVAHTEAVLFESLSHGGKDNSYLLGLKKELDAHNGVYQSGLSGPKWCHRQPIWYAHVDLLLITA